MIKEGNFNITKGIQYQRPCRYTKHGMKNYNTKEEQIIDIAFLILKQDESLGNNEPHTFDLDSSGKFYDNDGHLLT